MECTVCLEAFDHEARRPKSLPCGHTLCLRCLQDPAINNLCPQDRQAFEGDPATFPDNFAMLAVVAEARGVWCEVCWRQFSGDCADAGHRPCSERQRRAAQQQQPRPDVAELQRELRELRQSVQLLQGQVEDQQQRGTQPARHALDVTDLSTNRGLQRDRNELLLEDYLSQVRKLTGLDCSVDVAWAEAVLLKVGPHIEELHVSNVNLQHLRAIQGMSMLKTLHLACYGLDANADVPLLPLQLEKLWVKDFRKGHLLSLQWMPRLRELQLVGSLNVPLSFSPVPDDCGIRTMSLHFWDTVSLLSLVRAHAATIRTLGVAIASYEAHPDFRRNFPERLHQCGLVALRRLRLIRKPTAHDGHSCRVHLGLFRARFGQDVVVQCTLCDV